MNWKHAIAISIILAPLAASSQQASPEVERVASIMFQRFDVVIYTKTDFLTDYERARNVRPMLQSEVDHHTYSQSKDSLILPFLNLVAELKSLGPDAASHFEGGFEEVIGGAKDLVAPQGLGMGDSTHCYVGIGKSGASPDMASTVSTEDRVLPSADPLPQPITIKAPRQTVIAGRTQWNWSLPFGEAFPGKTQQLYAMQIGDNFAICDSQVEIVELLKALVSPNPPKWYPQQHSKPKSEDWDAMSPHSYWAYRTLDSKTAGEIAGQLEFPPSTTSLAVYTDPGDQSKKEVTFRITDGDSKTPPRAFTPYHPQGLPDSIPLKVLNFTADGEGTWKATMPLGTTYNDSEPLFIAIVALGFGIRT